MLQSCSAIKLAYNNLPELSYWWVDGYADLNEAQTLQLRADLARLHDWHRANELGKIADLLQQVQRMAPQDTSPEDVCGLYSDIRQRLDAVALQAEPAATAMVQTLTATQLKHIEARQAKDNAEWRKQWGKLDPAERADKRVKSDVERAEEFYGNLDDAQRAPLRATMHQPEFDSGKRQAERVRRQQDLLQTLRTINGSGGKPRLDAAQTSAALRAYQDRFARSPNLEHRAFADAAVLENCRRFAALHNTTSAQQRARAVGRLAAYERDARELARPR